MDQPVYKSQTIDSCIQFSLYAPKMNDHISLLIDIVMRVIEHSGIGGNQ